MTDILGITSYKQEDHLLGLVWVTILGLVFELFRDDLLVLLYFQIGCFFNICSANFLNTLHIGIKYECWEFLSHKYSIHWLGVQMGIKYKFREFPFQIYVLFTV